MLDVVIALLAAPAIGQSQLHPVVGRVNGAAKLLRIDERFNHQDGMAILSLPIRAQPVQRQAQHSRSEIGHRKFWQNQEAAVVGHQAQAPVTLDIRPADPLLTVLQMFRCRAEEQQRQPLPLGVHRDVIDLLADRLKTAQVMMGFEQPLEPSPILPVRKLDHLNFIKNALLGGGRLAR